MAIAPTFISDMTTLKSRLRLSGAAQPDALALIDTAVQTARMYLFGYLGSARVAVIQTKPYNENAQTADEITRLSANLAELLLVRITLLRTMPILFMDSSGAKRENWNEEGFDRRASPKELQDEIDRLTLQVEQILAGILTDGAVDTATNTQGGTIDGDPICNSPIQIGRSIQGGYNHYQDRYGNFGAVPGDGGYVTRGGCF